VGVSEGVGVAGIVSGSHATRKISASANKIQWIVARMSFRAERDISVFAAEISRKNRSK
jgi:hypothetical protein